MIRGTVWRSRSVDINLYTAGFRSCRIKEKAIRLAAAVASNRTYHENRSEQAKRRTCQVLPPSSDIRDHLDDGNKRMTRSPKRPFEQISQFTSSETYKDSGDMHAVMFKLIVHKNDFGNLLMGLTVSPAKWLTRSKPDRVVAAHTTSFAIARPAHSGWYKDARVDRWVARRRLAYRHMAATRAVLLRQNI